MKKIIILLIISFLPLVDLLHPGIPKGHDTPDHVARIANFYQSLSEGNLIPRWAGNLNWGYGHPILMFLYPFPSYIASLFHLLGFSLFDSTKLVFAVMYIASILAMYLFAQTAWGVMPGFIAAVLYGFAPYRFVDLYVRGAIGEHVAFVFPPIIFWGMVTLAKSTNKFSGIAISLGTAELLLSHNAVSLMVLPIMVLYAAYLWFFEAKNRRHFFLLTAYCLLTGFLLSAFFWMPAFFEGKYTLRDIVTKGDFTTRFVPWQAFLISPWNYGGGNEFSKELGIAQWASILAAIVVFLRVKTRSVHWFIGVSLMTIIISLWLMMGMSSVVWEKVSILQKFQFPWRFLTIAVIVTSLLTAVAVSHMPKRFRTFIVYCLLLIAIITTAPMWRAKDYIIRPESYYSGIYESTTDTGESSPIWSVRFMERQPKAMYEVIGGDASITYGLRTTTRHEFIVRATTEARVVDNTLYFPGWSVLVDNQKATVEFQDPAYRGLMTFRVPAGEHRVVVHFGETKLRRIANLISAGALVALIFYAAFRRYRHV